MSEEIKDWVTDELRGLMSDRKMFESRGEMSSR